MTDYTQEITALQRARIDMQTVKASNRVTIKAKYAEVIRQETADADAEAEIRFARLLADAVRAGVPSSLIRAEVLRTNTWSRWTYWRDLAGIEPDRVTIRNASEERRREASPFRWNENRDRLTVLRVPGIGKNAEDVPLADPVVYIIGPGMRRSEELGWRPEAEGADPYTGKQAAQSEAYRAHPGGANEFTRYVSAEIERAITAGEVTL